MKHNLRRRIEALEKIQLIARNIDPRHLTEALYGIEPKVAELLITALRAEREGRELSRDELDAKRAYRWKLSKLSRPDPIEGFEEVLDVHEIIVRVSSHKVRGEMPLLLSAREAQIEGRPLTPEESVTAEKFIAEYERLSCLAGLCAPDGTDLKKEGPR
jgi:hypothetical protein